MKVKYINDDKVLGIKYDWGLIRKAYRALHCPADVYDPTTAPLEYCKYFVESSERNIGKTTNWLLLGLCMHELYGTVIEYIRQTEDMIMPKNTRTLFDTILTFDYVNKVTDGTWNSVTYKSRFYYYCNVDEAGNIIEIDNKPFMHMCSVDKSEELKSGYNSPYGDLIIFDEFVGKYYYPNEFVYFCDTCKTIMRSRRSPIIVMLANTINPYSPYYNELMIYDEMQTMNIGDKRTVQTPLGTKLYVEIIGAVAEKKAKNEILNKLFFGFKNPMLGSITGENWAIKPYQHIPELSDNEEVQTISRQLYILYNNKIVRLDIVLHSSLGQCIYAHWASRTYEDSIIITAEDRLDKRYRYRYGTGAIEKYIKTMFAQNRFYYAHNDVGQFIESYFKYVDKLLVR